MLIPYFKSLSSLPNDKILDWSQLKAFADYKINVTKELKFVPGREENIVEKLSNVKNRTIHSYILLALNKNMSSAL